METITRQIINQEMKLLAKTDPTDSLIDLIDDEFIEYTSNGKVHDKNEAARWLALEEYSAGTGAQFEAKFLSETVILLTYISDIKRDQSSESKPSRRISIWRQKNGTWRMVFHQGVSLK